MGTGLRKGEISALKWDDIDIEHKLLYIKKNLAFVKNNHVSEEFKTKKTLITTTKTKLSKRTLQLNDTLMDCLMRQKEQQEKDKLIYKDIYEDKNLIFASETGDYLSPRKILTEIKKIYKEAGISTTHAFHDLRHTFCSILINKNVNVKTISELMGLTITLDIYATLFDEMKAKAMESVDDILNMAI